MHGERRTNKSTPPNESGWNLRNIVVLPSISTEVDIFLPLDSSEGMMRKSIHQELRLDRGLRNELEERRKNLESMSAWRCNSVASISIRFSSLQVSQRVRNMLEIIFRGNDDRASSRFWPEFPILSLRIYPSHKICPEAWTKPQSQKPMNAQNSVAGNQLYRGEGFPKPHHRNGKLGNFPRCILYCSI